MTGLSLGPCCDHKAHFRRHAPHSAGCQASHAEQVSNPMKKTNWKVPAADRSLSTFVEALIGLRIVVELNNDAIARGMLESSDGGMNLTLTEASLQPLQVKNMFRLSPTCVSLPSGNIVAG